MNNPILHIIDKTYENEDVFSNIVTYAFRLNSKQTLPIFCYGIWPPTYENIVNEFETTRKQSKYKPTKHVWHIVLSFPYKNIESRAYCFANDIAKVFAQNYQIFYTFHNDTEHGHFHFFINTTSFIPEYPILDHKKMKTFEEKILYLASNNYKTSLNINWKIESMS